MTEDDIVYLETKMERFRGRWQAMSRIARMGIVSSIFGGIGLITSFFQDYIPFLSMPFSVIGLLIGTTAFLAGFYHNLRRDGFWFPLFGATLSMLGLSIALGGWNNFMQTQEQEIERQREEARAQFVGRWLRGGGESQQSLEMTQAGSLLWKGAAAASEAEATVAKFQFRHSTLVISFGDSGEDLSNTMVRYNVDLSQKERLLLSDRRVIFGDPEIDLSGVWNRVGPPRLLTEAEKEIADYQEKLERFREQDQRITTLLEKFEADRQDLLAKLKPYIDGEKEKDDQWTVWARELATLRDQIEHLKGRQPLLEKAIVVLDAAIGRLKREAEFDKTQIDRTQMEDLLLTTDKLDEELKTIETEQDVEELILQQTVNEEMEREAGSR